MKKKIAICTLYDSVNCGTFLQAYSLKKTFEKLGFEVFFLKLKNDNSKITKSKEKRNIQIKEILIKLIRKIKLQFVFKKANKQFKTIELDELNNDTSFEYVIIGSDEIWNINNNSFTHYIEYFGYNFKNKKIIAYAPSANDTTKEDLLNKYEKINFNNFYKLSARDKNTKNLLEQMQQKKVTDVLDPTMIIDNFNEIIENTSLKNYIVVYGHRFNEKQKNEIIKFAKEKKLKTISITKYYDWCDKSIVASPGKFLSYIKNANYIITSTFHGSVFSILFKKNFAVYLNNGSKISDLLNKFELKSRIADYKNIDDIIKNDIDYNNIDKILNKYKNQSIKFIKDSINSK